MQKETFTQNVRSSQDNKKHFVTTVRFVDGVPVDQSFKTVDIDLDKVQQVPVPDLKDGDLPEDKKCPVKEGVKAFVLSTYKAEVKDESRN